MNKILFFVLSFVVVSKTVFAEDKVDYNKPFDEIKEQVSDFDQRHSLMPVDVKPVLKNNSVDTMATTTTTSSEDMPLVINAKKKEEENTVEKADVSELNNTKTQSEQFLKPEQKVIVKEEVKPVYVVPPAFPDADKKAMEQAKQDLENDFFIPDVNDNNNIPVKKENEEIKKNGGTVADVPSVTEEAKTLPDAKNEPFVLKQVPQKKYDGTDIILSNVIEEKAGTMENHPLIINKNRDGGKKTDLLIPNENMNEAKVENASVVEPVANVAPTSLVKPVVSSERNDIINSIPVIQRPVAKKTVPQNIVEEKDVLTAHIASYTTRETAERGIEIWKEKYPLITLLKSSIKYENVPEKGMFYRVYLTGSEAKLENLCNQMKSNNDWCNILR